MLSYVGLSFINVKDIEKVEVDCRLDQWFPNFFLCRDRKSVEKISRHTSHWNLFQLMSSGITGNDAFFLYFLETTTFMGHDLGKSRDAAPNGADFPKKVITFLAVTYHGIIFSILAENL